MKSTLTLLSALLLAPLAALHAAPSTDAHIVETQGKGPNDKFQLYNFRTDPGEASNVFAQEPDKAKELFAALKEDIARGRSR